MKKHLTHLESNCLPRQSFDEDLHLPILATPFRWLLWEGEEAWLSGFEGVIQTAFNAFKILCSRHHENNQKNQLR